MSSAYCCEWNFLLTADDKMPEVKEGGLQQQEKGEGMGKWGVEVHSDAHEKLPHQLPCPPPMTIKEPCGRHKWRNRPPIAAIAVTCVTPRRNS